MAKTPDYRSDLDLYVASESYEVVSFATIWYDAANKIGILEPVGTHYDYRRMGLARAVIGEGARRIADCSKPRSPHGECLLLLARIEGKPPLAPPTQGAISSPTPKIPILYSLYLPIRIDNLVWANLLLQLSNSA